MGLLSRILGTGDVDTGNERPPKPDVEAGQKAVTRTRYEATVEYRNGDVETFECYGIYSRGEDRVKFNTNPYGKRCLYDKTAEHSYGRRKINYETLAREPELTELGTDTFILTFTRNWDWSTGPGYDGRNTSYDWHEKHEDIELEIRRNTGE